MIPEVRAEAKVASQERLKCELAAFLHEVARLQPLHAAGQPDGELAISDGDQHTGAFDTRQLSYAR